MKKLKISMLGAGSGFVLSIARELNNLEIFQDSEFMRRAPIANCWWVGPQHTVARISGAGDLASRSPSDRLPSCS